MKFDRKSGSIYVWKLTGPEFIHNFTKFNNTFKGKEKPYKKINYQLWCDLNKHASGVNAELWYDKGMRHIHVWAGKQWCEEIQICGTHASGKNHTFSLGDNSFGDFLYNELVKNAIKEADLMNVNGILKNYSNATTCTSVNCCDGSAVSAKTAVDNVDLFTKEYSYADKVSVNGSTLNESYSDLTIPSNTSIYTWDTISSTWDTVSTKADIEDVNHKIKEHEDKYHNNKENEKMKFANFDFGPCTGDNVRMSMYGLAVKNGNGTWVSYDKSSNSIMDVDIFNFDGAKFLYKIPVAVKDIKPGDVIIHNRVPIFVTVVNRTSVVGINPVAGEIVEVMLTRSPFGFNFATKVVNFMDGFTSTAATEANPFGNMWMFMLMSDSGKMDDILPLMMMSQNGGNMNPMMMYALMSDNKNMKDVLPFLLMGNGWTNFNDTSAQN